MVMKTKYMIPVLLLAAFSVACNKETPEPQDTQAPSGELVELSARIGAPSTKIHFEGDFDTYTDTRWQAADQIWVRSDTQPYWERGECFSTAADKISADGHSASFEGRTRTDGKLAAVYPFGSVAPGSDNDKVVLDIPQSRPLVVGDCPEGANAAVAFWADGASSFSMNYVFGAMKIGLTGNGEKIKRVEIIDLGDAALWGSCEIEPDYDAKGIASVKMVNTSGDRNTIGLDAEGITLSATPVEFYFILPEGAAASGFTLKVTDAENNEYAFISNEAANAIVRGKVVKMPAVDMTASVPWDSGSFASGNGTETDPYIISSADELIVLSNKVNNANQYAVYADKYYKQTADIDMEGKAFTPVAASAASPFTGHYDGGGKTISNLSTQGLSADDPASGIFGYTNGAEIKNIVAKNRVNTGTYVRVGGIIGFAENTTVSNCSLSGGELGASANICGGIVGHMVGGKISDCTVSSVTVKSTKNYVGGIVAYAPSAGIIENCSVENATVSANEEIGGIIGNPIGTTVSGCTVKGSTITSGTDDVGGIAGWSKGGTAIEGCVVEGCTITATTEYAAGIAGLPESTTMKDCTVKGSTISGATGIGGVAGFFKNTASVIDGCVVDGCEITASKTNLGGLVGRFDLGEIKNSTVKGGTRITGIDSVGGIAGRPITRGGNCIIDNCFVIEGTSIKGTFYLGGIAGYVYPDSNYLLTIANCGVDGCIIESTQLDTSDSKCGGIVGYVRLTDANSNARILNCYAYNCSYSLPATSTPSVGGIFGYAKLHASNPGYLQVASCSSNIGAAAITAGGAAITDASSAAYVGGVFGRIEDSAKVSVESCVFVSDGGIEAGNAGTSVVLKNNQGFTGAAFKDGTSPLGPLNSFVLSFKDYTLSFWGADADGLPVFSDEGNINGVDIDYDDDVIVLN